MESMAYSIRKNLKQKARVKLGKSDIELSARESGSIFWKRQKLPDDLPGIDMEYGKPHFVFSPPPGRPYNRRLEGNCLNPNPTSTEPNSQE